VQGAAYEMDGGDRPLNLFKESRRHPLQTAGHYHGTLRRKASGRCFDRDDEVGDAMAGCRSQRHFHKYSALRICDEISR